MERIMIKYSAQKSQRGIFLVFFAICLVALCLFLGLAIDTGHAYLVKAELERTVDSAALAAASQLSAGQTAYNAAACNAALMNGVSCNNLLVSPTTTTDATGATVSGLKVSARAASKNAFMQLGKLVGCGNACNAVSVGASSVAAPGGSLDIAMSLDDTASMQSWISSAQTGARALINALVPAGATSSAAKVAVVPFRGCYSTSGSGCVNPNDFNANNNRGNVMPLWGLNTPLINSASSPNYSGAGGSGTNVCVGLTEARLKLFQSGVSRPTAQKFMIILTDAQSSPSHASNFASCTGNNENEYNYKAYKVAQDIKNGTNVAIENSGQLSNQTVELFVIFYGTNAAHVTVPANCTPPPNGSTQFSTTYLNLARCMASKAADVYLAPTAAQITTAFQQIVSRLPVRLVK